MTKLTAYEEDYFRQGVEMMVKEAMRTFGPGRIVDAIKAIAAAPAAAGSDEVVLDASGLEAAARVMALNEAGQMLSLEGALEFASEKWSRYTRELRPILEAYVKASITADKAEIARLTAERDEWKKLAGESDGMASSIEEAAVALTDEAAFGPAAAGRILRAALEAPERTASALPHEIAETIAKAIEPRTRLHTGATKALLWAAEVARSLYPVPK